MWFFEGSEFTSEDIGDSYGFVYCITNTVTGRKYIGKKFFWSVTRKPPLKGKVRKRVVKKESNWQKYWGSSDYLNEDIEKYGKEAFKREILHLCRNKSATNFMETVEQIHRQVLTAKLETGEWEYYNENIEQKYYRSNI